MIAGGARAHWGTGFDGQRRADLGDGTYRNPVLAGDRPDPSVLRDGEDYYAVFSTFVYYPGAVIWRSRDLVNWSPIGPALTIDLGAVFAPDLIKHEGRFFLYLPVFRIPAAGDPPGTPLTRNYVIWADDIAGPWSEPIDIGVDGLIDPGHIVGEDGKRYLFLNEGKRVQLSDDGLKAVTAPEQVYEGWPIPQDWVLEGRYLEAPKLLWKDGWLYMFSADGGTAGVPTSHMVIVARSRSVHGPWENCPENPVVRTQHRAEPWWSRGHATPVEGQDGSWWLAYHAYENGLRTLGRQMILEPIEWTADGWPRAVGGDLGAPLPMPPGGSGPAGIAISGPFDDAMWGTRLAFYKPKEGYLDRARISDGALILAGQGDGPGSSSPATFVAGDPHYEVEVELTVSPGAEGGLLLFYKHDLFCGLTLKDGMLTAYGNGQAQRLPQHGVRTTGFGSELLLRVVNDREISSFFYRERPNLPWRLQASFEVSGYNQNTAGWFLSLRPSLCAAGEGQTTFRNLRYRALD